MYKIGIIIPDRGDRPEMMQQCSMYVTRLALRAADVGVTNVEVLIQDYDPESDACDITQRYRRGYDELRGKGLDCIFFIENDDWYSEDYICVMLEEWKRHGRPNMLGTSFTEYYHIGVRGHWTVKHNTRSSAMSTLIKADLNFPWCPDHEPYTDVHLWRTVGHKANGKDGIIFTPQKQICIGIKHGIGKTGGRSHLDRLDRYGANQDPDLQWLRKNIGADADFYEKFVWERGITFVKPL